MAQFTFKQATMNNKHKLITGLAAAAILAGGASTLPNALAAESSTTTPFSSLVVKIATKFNLNQSEVQAVFDDEHAARKSEMQTKMKEKTEERLTEAVESGDLTQVQKDLITAKQAEAQTKMDEIQKIEDQGDRQAAIAQYHADLTKWAADNDISARWLMRFGGPGEGMGGHGMRGHFPGGPENSSSLN